MESNKTKPSEQEVEDYCTKFLNKLKQDEQYELKQEFGNLLMRHIDSFSPEERKRYDELIAILKD